ARVDAAGASRRALAVGAHEFEASIGTQRRRAIEEGRDFAEWDLQISRAIRLPGKAALDRQIGDSLLGVADLRRTDAEHQAARRLLELWMGWLRSAAAATESAAQAALLRQERDALARRVAVGDAAQRELDLLDAEQALLAAQAVAARDAAEAARQTLAIEFPRIAVPPQPPALPDPQPLPGGSPAWRERIVGESAEIGLADGESQRMSLQAARLRAERRPDPRVGLRLLSERGGAERTVGLVLSVPLGTGYRSARADAETANAAAAEAEAQGVRRLVEQAAWLAVQAADSRRTQWQSQQRALSAQETASTRLRRAWELGETPLAEYLLTQRSLRQARLAEALARVDALHAALLVRVDAHELWHPGGQAGIGAHSPAP
ncbi:TolC family protein, partial [Tahibacter caeni]|uniref:TolC family protein n=1 Tax=Tahibacter caeni TaxID=1453545 RepID=UPI002149945C